MRDPENANLEEPSFDADSHAIPPVGPGEFLSESEMSRCWQRRSPCRPAPGRSLASART